MILPVLLGITRDLNAVKKPPINASDTAKARPEKPKKGDIEVPVVCEIPVDKMLWNRCTGIGKHNSLHQQEPSHARRALPCGAHHILNNGIGSPTIPRPRHVPKPWGEASPMSSKLLATVTPSYHITSTPGARHGSCLPRGGRRLRPFPPFPSCRSDRGLGCGRRLLGYHLEGQARSVIFVF